MPALGPQSLGRVENLYDLDLMVLAASGGLLIAIVCLIVAHVIIDQKD